MILFYRFARCYHQGKLGKVYILKLHVGIPWWLSGLRIWHCRCHGKGSIPGPGTSVCPEYNPTPAPPIYTHSLATGWVRGPCSRTPKGRATPPTGHRHHVPQAGGGGRWNPHDTGTDPAPQRPRETPAEVTGHPAGHVLVPCRTDLSAAGWACNQNRSPSMQQVLQVGSPGHASPPKECCLRN